LRIRLKNITQTLELISSFTGNLGNSAYLEQKLGVCLLFSQSPCVCVSALIQNHAFYETIFVAIYIVYVHAFLDAQIAL